MSTPSELRRAVLDAWAASPDRFREDANAEEDAALGAYRDRAVVELAQNAADAAVRAGAPGRLVLRLEDAGDDGGARLLALNTGAPLDAEGVRALSSLRASAKRTDASLTGRFGVGAVSVLAVSDDVTWVSRAGGVRFSADLARAAVADRASEALDAAVAARGGAVPVLRLPFAVSADDGPQDVRSLLDGEGCDTAAVVVLRDRGAVEEVAAALEAVDDTLLLALPALAEVVVQLPGAPPRVLRDVSQRWHLLRRRGAFEPDELEGLGVEERERAARTGWSVTWALPREPRHLPGVLLAPTPTDEPLDAPAVLVADLPLDAGRRRVPDGPAARRALREAGAAYAALLEERALAGEDVLEAVPVGLAAGWVDAAVREAAVQALGAARVLQPVGETGGPLRADRAQALDDGPLADDPTALAALAPLVGGLVAAPRRARAALEVLGVRRVGLADVAEVLPSDPAAWRAAAAALAPAAVDPAAREQLAVLRVPLADGRTAASPRGVLLPSGGEDGVLAAALEDLADAGLRLVHPLVVAEPAAVRLLTALGAQPAGPGDLLAAPEVAQLVVDLDDDDERVPHLLALVAEAVRAQGLAPGDLPALAELPLRAESGEVLPAAGLVLPGSPAAGLLDPDEVAPVHPDLLERWGEPVLAAVGVADALAVVPLGDVDPHDPPTELLDVAGGQEWLDEVLERAGDGAVASGVAVVRDLDLLREGAEGALLEHLAAVPALRSAVLDPVRVVRPDGSSLDLAPPSAGWLRAELGLAGCAAPGCEEGLAAVLPQAPAWAGGADPALGRALGLVAASGDLDADGWQRVLDGAADLVPPVRLEAVAVLPLWRALAEATSADPALAEHLVPPSHVLALDAGAAVVVVPAERAAVVDDPCWAQRTDLGARLVAGADLAAALADALEISLSSELAPGRVDPVGSTTTSAVPPQVRSALPGCPPRWTEHDALTVDGQEVGWWVTGRGEHADVRATTVDGLARGLALAAGRWHARALVAELLAVPDRAAAALVEDAAGERA
ncbi:sacsin N-terminal ATP-binding-like domain-containing protein [Quadrisphaera setariae]|uniref:sacsin N-terminal ATP-binding-like domain-containing protein n=1 Tax=Quadrisphaera setariae TaxID=2593304 RepID=UPI001650BBC9|nr:hypothetical protein [Quadrisphaera setariae]